MNKGKVVLITGCSSGFGYGMALKFAREKYPTFASVRNLNSPGAKKLIDIAQQEDLPLEVGPIDVTSDASVTTGVKKVVEKAGTIHILINNAGFGYLGAVEDFTIDEVKAQYDTNIFGVLRMIRAVAPVMRQKKQGKIINMSSISGLVPFPLYGVYCSSKFAIEAISEALSFELRPFGVRVVLIEPGIFSTSFWENKKHPRTTNANASPYNKLTSRFFNRLDRGKKMASKGILGWIFNPQKVIDRVFEIANQDDPTLRHIVGIDAHLQYGMRRYLPEDVRNFILHQVFKW